MNNGHTNLITTEATAAKKIEYLADTMKIVAAELEKKPETYNSHTSIGGMLGRQVGNPSAWTGHALIDGKNEFYRIAASYTGVRSGKVFEAIKKGEEIVRYQVEPALRYVQKYIK